MKDNEDEPPQGEGLDREDNWMLRTSPGMRQRLALAHVLLQKPKLLFLDEATSNMSKSGTIKMYNTLRQSLPSDAAILSISHDVSTLADFHEIHYCAQGEGDSKMLVLSKHVEHTDPLQMGDFALTYQDGTWTEVGCAQAQSCLFLSLNHFGFTDPAKVRRS